MSESNPSPNPSPRDDLRIVIIGAGMSGILCGIKLQEAGLQDFAIYEKGTRPGGTWHENRYPGLSCDVPSHLYRYSFEPNPNWTQAFSPGSEIHAYFEGVIDKYGLRPKIECEQEIVACEFSEGKWNIRTDKGLEDQADIVIAATGVLHHPNYPDIEGLEDFEGHLFHSARWDESVDLEGKRVGIIGTGSTAVQITAAIVSQVHQLSLFQRTAQWVMTQDNQAYSEEEKENFRNHPEVMEQMYEEISTQFSQGFSNALVDADSEPLRMLEQACREHLETGVRDPELREALRPTYRAACKRLVISGDFYEAIQKPNAELVTEGIERVEAGGVRTREGRLHELDVLVLATGFNAHQFMRPMNIVGRGGTKLDSAWQDSNLAYRSVAIPEFPNFFMVMGPNSPVGNFSLIEVAEMQFAFIMQLIDRIRSGECLHVAPTTKATDEFNQALVEASRTTIWSSGCKSWYLDKNGVPQSWPWTFDRFREEMQTPLESDFEFSA